MTLFQSTVGRLRPAKDCHDCFQVFELFGCTPSSQTSIYHVMLCIYIYNTIYTIWYIYIYPKYIWDVYHIFGPPKGFSFCHSSSWNQPSPRQARTTTTQRPTPRGCSNVASPAFSGLGKSTWPRNGGDGSTLVALEEIDDFPSERYLHFFSWFSMAVK